MGLMIKWENSSEFYKIKRNSTKCRGMLQNSKELTGNHGKYKESKTRLKKTLVR